GYHSLHKLPYFANAFFGWTIIAFKERKEFSFIKHFIVPVLGLIANIAMLGAIIYLYIIGNSDAKIEAYICFVIAGLWAAAGALYVVVNSRRSGRSIIGYKEP
ncbi:MAG: hypothetical protein ACPL1H_04635, partial [bacterium]